MILSKRPWIMLDLLFEPRDMWIGWHWKSYPKAIEIYWCIIPMVPIYLYVQWGE